MNKLEVIQHFARNIIHFSSLEGKYFMTENNFDTVKNPDEVNSALKSVCRLKSNNITVLQKEELALIQFNNLLQYEDILAHAFTTRLGGVSSGECSSLNLSFNRNDSEKNVKSNYRIVADALELDYSKIVLSNQVHDNKIFVVGEKDAGKGLTKESDILGYDGLITNCIGVPLVTFFADCVPVLMLDPENKAIAAVHSGWRSTVRNISYEAVKLMQSEYGTKPEALVVAIGPSLCQQCFEVSKDVYEEFANAFSFIEMFSEKIGDKYYISLQKVIRKILMDANVKEENILISDICTKCNNDVFFSYRGDYQKTGSLAAFMMLK